jgi:hypothetical protein
LTHVTSHYYEDIFFEHCHWQYLFEDMLLLD